MKCLSLKTSLLHLMLIVHLLTISSWANAQSKAGEATVNVGSTTTISLASTYQNTLARSTGISYRWYSADSDVSVTSSSKTSCTIKGVNPTTSGRVYYYCSYYIDGFYRTMDFYYTVTVKANTVYVTSVSLNYSNISLEVGDTRQLNATVYPSNATNSTVSWSSSDNAVATVSYGLVTAKSAGSATITCRATDGSGKYATCYVSVSNPTVYVSSISLNSTSASLNVGETKQLSATVYPSNATNKTVSWSSSDNSVAAVSNGLVTAKAEGQAKITCRANDGSGKYATCDITVKGQEVFVTKILLDTYSITEPVGYTHEFSAAVLPDNATNKTLSWSSSNSDIAWIGNDGTLILTGVGTATVKCEATDGSGVYATCAITSTSETASTPDLQVIDVVCDNKNLDNMTYNDKLIFHATYCNSGATDDIYSAIVLCDENMERIVRISDLDVRTYKTNDYVSVNYELSLKGLPKGNYSATVMYYDHWKNDSYMYSDYYVKKFTIVDDGNFKKGDVNLDGFVDVSDIVFVINFMAGNDSFYFCDVNDDEKVDISDIVAIINIIAGLGVDVEEPVKVTTGEAADITDASAMVAGTVEGITEDANVGFIYGTSDNLSSANGKLVTATHGDSFSIQLSSLQNNTMYYYRAFVEVNGKYYYGDILSFKTASLPKFTLLTQDASDIMETTANLNGSISITDAKRDYTVGFVVGTSSNPSLSNALKTLKAGSNINGSFSTNVSGLSANTTYYVRAYLLYGGTLDYYGEAKSFSTKERPTTGTLNGHEWVDLGLPSGLRWATCNIGASTPGGYGNAYACGETSTKTKYSEGTYTIKRNLGDFRGTNYDAAYVNWGTGWRMPSGDEMKELRSYCQWTWTTRNGNKGYLIEGSNGKSIFLPAAGCYSYDDSFVGSQTTGREYADVQGFYWCGECRYVETALTGTYYCFGIMMGFEDNYIEPKSSARGYWGCSVRAVCE